jgi:hypothetical protein
MLRACRSHSILDVGAKDWLRRLVAGNGDRTPDGREMVYLATAPLYEAALFTATLRARGVDARYVETTNPLTRSLTDGKIFVPRAQLAQAEAALDDDSDELDDTP